MKLYQDDCIIALNENGVFAQHFHLIYPPEMVLKCTNISKAVCTFLDLRISIFRGQFRYTSFDKRKDFSFDIVIKYPDLSGNIPLKPSYGVYTSQLVRYCDINQSSSGFVSDVKDMTSCFLNQNFVSKTIKELYSSFCSKFGVDVASNEVISKVPRSFQ